MAGTLLHVTLAEAALRTAGLPSSVRKDVETNLDDFRLGAVIFDLPYYNHFLLRGIQLFVTKRLGYNGFGHLLHLKDPTGFSLALLTDTRSAADRAFALGSLTHLAVDVVFHPEIELLVADAADDRMCLNRLHRQVEDKLDCLSHLHLLGHRGMGTPYAPSMLTLNPRSRWQEMVITAAGKVLGTRPSRERLARWLTALSHFGKLHGDPRFPWVPRANRLADPLASKARLLADEAVGLSGKYLVSGAEYLEKRVDEDQFLVRVPPRNLITGMHTRVASSDAG